MREYREHRRHQQNNFTPVKNPLSNPIVGEVLDDPFRLPSEYYQFLLKGGQPMQRRIVQC